MGIPQKPLTLTPEQIEELNRKLSDMRHSINNSLSLITATSEIIHRKPELAEKLVGNLIDQPQKIIGEILKFSGEFDRVMGITRPL